MFGEMLNFLANKAREQGKKIGKTTAIVVDNCYIADAEMLFDEVHHSELFEFLMSHSNEFDYIILSKELTDYIGKDSSKLLKMLKTASEQNVTVVFTAKNPNGAAEVFELSGKK